MDEQTFIRVEADLMDYQCPQCGHGVLEMRMRCDLQFGDCVLTGVCGECGTSFAVNHESLADDQVDELPSEPSRKVLVCDAATHECQYVEVSEPSAA